ncbi:hypothetical protein Dimus_009357 [Dionaea muscipula]
MEANAGAALSRHRKSSSSDRFMKIFTPPPSATAATAGDELNEEDVFWTGDFAESSQHSSSPSTSSTPHSQQHIHGGKGFNRAENHGILAALPEKGPGKVSRSVFNHKSSTSPSSSSPASSSSARMIPTLPKPPAERSLPMSYKYHRSAPVSVPMMPKSAGNRLRDGGFGYVDDEEVVDDEEGEMLPPHEIVERQAAKIPVISCSVLEGAGRTLKGRDLRQVRNAVFQKTEGGGKRSRVVDLMDAKKINYYKICWRGLVAPSVKSLMLFIMLSAAG